MKTLSYPFCDKNLSPFKLLLKQVMPKTVLNVGQCRPDTASIGHFLQSNFGASMVSTDLMGDTLDALRTQSIDLVLINRKLDADYSDGMAILKAIQQDDALSAIPVSYTHLTLPTILLV